MVVPSNKEVQALLERLCIDLGFCLDPADQQQLVEDPPEDPTEFAREVLRREGVNIEEAGLQMFRQIRDRVAEAFRRATDVESRGDQWPFRTDH